VKEIKLKLLISAMDKAGRNSLFSIVYYNLLSNMGLYTSLCNILRFSVK